MSTTTLDQELRSILFQDHTGDGPIGTPGKHPGFTLTSRFTEFEGDLLDWGYVCGMAFGMKNRLEVAR